MSKPFGLCGDMILSALLSPWQRNPRCKKDGSNFILYFSFICSVLNCFNCCLSWSGIMFITLSWSVHVNRQVTYLNLNVKKM